MRTRLIPTFAALLAAAAACTAERETMPPEAPVTPQAAWLLEPAQIGVGQVTVLELAVATAPDHVLAPYAPPPPPPGLLLLGSETLPVERQVGRWLHRIRLRLRATAAGESTWPAGSVELEARDGSRRVVDLPEHPIEVVSILPEYPDRAAPFGVRAPRARSMATAPVWVPALLGAASTLAVVALVSLARRKARASSESDDAPEAAFRTPCWQEARQALEEARALSSREPFEAAHALSIALRRFVDRRFGSTTAGLSGEELREGEPPFAARSRWPALLAILAGLDALRFRPTGDREAREALEADLDTWLAAAARFIEDAQPPEASG